MIKTKNDVYNEIVMQDNRPICPDCGEEMVIWECPPFNFEDGSGWGTPYLYVCFNNDCPPYVNGWKSLKDNYGRTASCRCICYPGEEVRDYMLVLSRIGGTNLIMDEEIEKKRAELEAVLHLHLEYIKVYRYALDDDALLEMVLDRKLLPEIRLKAVEIIGEVGGLNVIEPIMNHHFSNSEREAMVKASIEFIHKRYHTKECPFCTEFVKALDVVCKHCKRKFS